jgi:phage repressor protein C with HTH and peptisase S24 domain
MRLSPRAVKLGTIAIDRGVRPAWPSRVKVSDPMSWAQLPIDAELDAFAARLQAWRTTLGEGEQRLVDSMVAAALGRTGDTDAGELPPVADPLPGRWCTVRWLATPWGMAHSVRYG